MTGDDNSGDNASGYGRPPAGTRFRKGQSGNPAGRPRGRYKEAPFEAVLGQMVTIREGGTERSVTAAEAFLLQLAKRGLEGDTSAARATITAIAEARSLQITGTSLPTEIVVNFVAPGSVNTALEPLRMAKKLDPYRETARMALEPWLVEAALVRLGDRRLTAEEQKTVVKATRTPWKVNWPEWWEVGP
jgi:hypothetical protein